MKFRLANAALADAPMLLADNPDDQRIAAVASFMLTFCAEYVKRHPIGGLEEWERAMRKAIALRFPNLTAPDTRKALTLAETVAEFLADRPMTLLPDTCGIAHSATALCFSSHFGPGPRM